VLPRASRCRSDEPGQQLVDMIEKRTYSSMLTGLGSIVVKYRSQKNRCYVVKGR
jgi:hypothetical protein